MAILGVAVILFCVCCPSFTTTLSLCIGCLDAVVTPSAVRSSSDNDEEDTEQEPSSSAEQQVAVEVEQPVPVPVKTPPKTLSKWQP